MGSHSPLPVYHCYRKIDSTPNAGCVKGVPVNWSVDKILEDHLKSIFPLPLTYKNTATTNDLVSLN